MSETLIFYLSIYSINNACFAEAVIINLDWYLGKMIYIWELGSVYDAGTINKAVSEIVKDSRPCLWLQKRFHEILSQ